MMRLPKFLRKHVREIIQEDEHERTMTNNVLRQAHRAVTVAYQQHIQQESLSGAKCQETQKLLGDELRRRGVFK